MSEDIKIYVDNINGRDSHPGTIEAPVRTAGKAFSKLPPSWEQRAEIIFAVTELPYEVETDAVFFGMPIGPAASPLVIRGGYIDVASYSAAAASGTGDSIQVTEPTATDELIGTVLTRTTVPSDDSQPMSSSIRGNAGSTIHLQQAIGAVSLNERFVVQRPAVTLRLLRTLNLTSHDSRSPNLTFIGIKFEPVEGAGLNLINVRAQCDTCEFSLRKLTSTDGRPTKFPNLLIHTNARIIGGIEIPDLSPDLPSRKQTGVFIYGDDPQCIALAIRSGILSGHLTFKGITVRVSQGGVITPQSLEALGSQIQILTGGSGIAQPSWGTAMNKARIRNVAGDGLRVFNGGALNSPLGPIHLDISACTRDGIRLDMGSTASFGPPGGPSGLVSTRRNGNFGLNVRNASRALIAGDIALKGGETDGFGDVTLDDKRPARQWSEVIGTPLSNPGMSLVRISS